MRIKKTFLAVAVTAGCACAMLAPYYAAAEQITSSPYLLSADILPELRVRDDPSYRLKSKVEPVAESETGALQQQANAAELAYKPFSKDIEIAAREANIDPALLHALIHVESRHRQKAVSPKGALGLMQVLPKTAARYGVHNPDRSPQANLKAGTLYLRDLMQLFGERLELVLAAYNAGEGAVQRYDFEIPPYKETRQYVRDVLAKYYEWRAPAQSAPSEPAAAAPSFIEYLAGTRLIQRPDLLR